MHTPERIARTLRSTVRGALACLLGLMLAATVVAAPKSDRGKGKGKDKSNRSGAEERHDADERRGRDGFDRDDDHRNDDRRVSDGRSIDRTDERILRRWFSSRENLRALPPGLAKRDSLPPGLARQIHQNGTLPHGLQKRLEPLPVDIDRRLPVLPPDVRRVVLGRDVLLVNDRTQQILDVVRDVLPR